MLQISTSISFNEKLVDIWWFFIKAGAFVFGSGLAIVPFLYGGLVKENDWLTEQQFLDAVAVAMITPGPVVITVAFIGYLIAGFPGACIAALATFIPCYLFTIIPAPYFKKYDKMPAIKSFVQILITAKFPKEEHGKFMEHTSPGRIYGGLLLMRLPVLPVTIFRIKNF